MKPPFEAWPQWLQDAIANAYREGVSCSMIGAHIGRTETKVRARLVRMGVYVSKAAAKKVLAATTAEEHGF